MSGDPADWRMRSIFQLRTVDGSKPVAITKALLLAVKGNRHWLFGGTSDLMLPDPDSLVSADRKLVNPEQFIFALNRDANPTMIGGSPVPLATSQLVALKYMKDGLYPPNPEAAGGEQVTVQSDAYGWYLKLRGKVSHGTDPTDPEYVTTAPFLYQGVLYVSTFVPRTRQPYDNEKCPELGDGKLYALDPLTGKSMWQGGQQALVFENIKISGISASMGKLFLGVKVLKGGALNQLKHISELGEFQIYAEGQYIAFDALGEPPTLKPDVQYNVPHLQYWKERF
jgi:outer membrane protein assembly factor BamB